MPTRAKSLHYRNAAAEQRLYDVDSYLQGNAGKQPGSQTTGLLLPRSKLGHKQKDDLAERQVPCGNGSLTQNIVKRIVARLGVGTIQRKGLVSSTGTTPSRR